ncbi:hypothetical protein K502DRAFT_369117 [Neoconidiobolus thromboides FSU 785]|nr:hypothetical protein K502DRAFT_369117 [Neoconidiobolus thromboides FSU 785]
MSEVSNATYVMKEVFPKVAIVSLSLACVVVVVMIALTIYDRKLVDRVSLRLQTVISCYDIWAHTFPLWTRVYNYRDSPLCTFIAYQSLAFPLFYTFLNVAIGINLQLIFIHGINITKRIEAAYWIGSILLTLIITIPPLAIGALGYSDFNSCYFSTDDESYSRLLDFYTSNLVMIISMGYLLIIVILVLIKLFQGLNLIKEHQVAMDASNSIEMIKNIQLLASRILLYPVIMIVANFGNVLSQSAYDLANFDSLDLKAFSFVAGGLLGTFNFIAFFCDPTIHQAFKVIYFRIWKKQNESTKTDYNDDVFDLDDVKNDKFKKDDDNYYHDVEGRNPVEYSKFIKTL